jgi:hypothetical protein
MQKLWYREYLYLAQELNTNIINNNLGTADPVAARAEA